MPAEEFYELAAAARRRSFTVSSVSHLGMIEQVQESLAKALETGEDMKAWKARVAPALIRDWGASVQDPNRRLEVIFRTNLQTAYNSGRHAQLTQPELLKLRPFWLYDAIRDGRTTELCAGLHGTLLPAGDPFWQTHTPPLHFQCRSRIRALRPAQAQARGGERPPPEGLKVQHGFGAAPTAVSPIPDWKPDWSRYDPKLVPTAREKARPPETTWEHWEPVYRARYSPEVARAIAKARARYENALDWPAERMRAVAQSLRARGLNVEQAWGSGTVREALDALGPEALDNPRRFEGKATVALAAHVEAIKPHRAIPLTVTKWPPGERGYANRIRRATAEFYRTILDESVSPPKPTLELDLAGRAYFSPTLNHAAVGSRGDAAHELGHALEHENPSIARLARAFFLDRTRGEERVNLAVLFPDVGYAADEVAKPDKFFHAYMGREYPDGSTEVMSMILEETREHPGYLARKDWESYLFGLGACSGS